MFFFSFLFCWAYAGDSPDHERGDGAQDESSGFQPEEHASRSPADEQTIPSQHSQVTFHYCNQGVMGVMRCRRQVDRSLESTGSLLSNSMRYYYFFPFHAQE